MIKIICVGKIKEKYLNDAIKDYSERLSKYTKIEVIEINEEKYDNDLEKNLIKEKDKILSKIKEKEYIIVLDINGIQLSSGELAYNIDNNFINYPTITFIIGSSHGLHEDIKNSANFKLSFSKLTFPHQLFRLVLLEQIYRSFKILNNEAYHK